MQSQVWTTLMIVLLTLVGAGVTTHLEEQTRWLLALQVLFGAEQPGVLRDQLHFLWVAGGALLGGYVAVALRQVTGLIHVLRCYAVSVATAIALAPYILVTWYRASLGAEACFGIGFLAAVAAWLGWEILGILAQRLKRAVRQRGWTGLREELLPPTSQRSLASPVTSSPKAASGPPATSAETSGSGQQPRSHPGGDPANS